MSIPHSPDDPAHGLDSIRRKVGPPAIGLIVVGLLGIVTALLQSVASIGIFALMAAEHGMPREREGLAIFTAFGAPVVLGLFTGIVYLVVIFAGLRMRKLKSHGFCCAGALASIMLICSLCMPLGLPVGIWSLIVLMSPDVKAAFLSNQVPTAI